MIMIFSSIYCGFAFKNYYSDIPNNSYKGYTYINVEESLKYSLKFNSPLKI